MAAVVLKVVCQGQTHRIPLKDCPDYAAVELAIRSLSPRPEAYVAKYLDEDGDLCTLVEATFSDFLSTALEAAAAKMAAATSCAAALRVLRVEVFEVLEATCACLVQGPTAVRPGLTWEEDPRDIEELLREIGEEEAPLAMEVLAKRKLSKQLRRNFRRSAKRAAKVAVAEEYSARDAASSRHAEKGVKAVEEGEEEEDVMATATLGVLRRSASCPCSLASFCVQAPPPSAEGPSTLLPPALPPDPRMAEELWPSTPEATPPQSPRCAYEAQQYEAQQNGTQQLVWVPMLLPLASRNGSGAYVPQVWMNAAPWVT